MKGKKWVSLFLAAVLLVTVVGSTGNMVFASEILGEETAEGTKKAEDSANKADRLDTEVKENNEEAENMDEVQASQEKDTLGGSLEENEVPAAEIEQAAGETIENAENAVLESPDYVESEEIMTLEGAPVPQAGDIASGSSGNVTWVIDADGKLTVSGEGTFSSALWGDYREQIVSADLTGVDTRNVTDMSYMFLDCNNLESLDLSALDTSSVINMHGMFWGCENLVSLDLSNFDTSHVTDMSGMFIDCSSLTSLDLSDFDTGSVNTMEQMFENCSSLTSLDLSNFNTSNVNTMEGMFFKCGSLISLDLSNFNTGNVNTMKRMFYSCGLTSLDLSNFNTDNVNTMEQMFSLCTSLTSLDLSNFNTRNVNTMAWMFETCSSLTSLNLNNFDTSNVNTMKYMFNECSSLRGLDLSDFNTGNVNTMEGMFFECSSLTNLDLNNFNTGNVNTMALMFYNCSSLTSLDLSNFNTSNVTNMNSMFLGCNSLTSLDLSNFNTSNVIEMNGIFMNCSGLTSLDLGNFNTSNVTNMRYMFADCNSLTSLDLSSFDISNVADMQNMLFGCSSLNTIFTPYKMKAPLGLNSDEMNYDKDLYTWYLPDGTEITEIPANLDHSVMIVRRKNPKIITTTADLNMEDVVRVKYVPYSYTVETNNTESDNIVTYSLVEGRLAEGLSLYPATGEIYGVPLETGSFPIRVKAEFSNPEYFPSYADLVLTVIDNTDSNIFDASDPGYELEKPVGEMTSGYGFVITQVEDLLFVSAGAYSEFIDLWLNGQKLTEGEDYTKESGSTRITIRSQTFLNKADKEGVNTLAAEFREGGLLTNPLRRTAQNFRLRIQQNSGYTGGGDSGGSESAIRTVNFAIRLVDAAGNALGGYTVELHSTPRVTKTNQKGIAIFRNVEEGPHTLYVKDAKGNILASRVFTLDMGGSLSLEEDRVTAKEGAAFTLQLQMTGSTLTLLQVQEGDVYRVIPAQTGDETNPELWLALLALLGTAALAGDVYRKRRNYV